MSPPKKFNPNKSQKKHSCLLATVHPRDSPVSDGKTRDVYVSSSDMEEIALHNGDPVLLTKDRHAQVARIYASEESSSNAKIYASEESSSNVVISEASRLSPDRHAAKIYASEESSSNVVKVSEALRLSADLQLGDIITIKRPKHICEAVEIKVSEALRLSADLQLGDIITIKRPKHICEAVEIKVSEVERIRKPDILLMHNIKRVLGDLEFITRDMMFTVTHEDQARYFTINEISGTTLTRQLSSLALDQQIWRVGPGIQVHLQGLKSVKRIDRSSSIHQKSKRQDETRVPSTPPPEATTLPEKPELPVVKFSDVGGLDKQIDVLKDMVSVPLMYPELFCRFGISPPRGVLLYGPPGTGKSLLLRALQHETGAYTLIISGPSIVSKYLGETEEKLRNIWQEAIDRQPSIIVVDELDAIAPKRNEEAEGRVVSTLLTLMDAMSGRVVVVASTNRPNVIDEALRRPGRFDREIEVGIPDVNARHQILKLQLDKMPHTLTLNHISSLAARTHGYTGADLVAICREAAMRCIKRGLEMSENNAKIDYKDIEVALTNVRPTAMREIFLEPPKVRWSDIGGQENVKQKLREAVEWPLSHPETFTRLGITPPKGVLLYGPPGCSKTLTAKALATEAGLNFMAVKGPELFNKYVGESERAVREVFRKARAASPSIIFFDEIDALSSSGESHSDRVLASLLNELDGIESLKDVVVLAATNRPDVIDPALLRPGRLDRIIYVGPPDFDARREIFRIRTRQMSVDHDVNIDELALRTDKCSGAEIAAICQDAGLNAMHENLDATQVHRRHFIKAVAGMRKGITQTMLQFYEDFGNRGS
ncbi:ATPase family gene 2 protein [Neolecta irregularis DAH-3]|uniref:ATPase family gene 2 protein n=1 Tax=Neolecta irregularis (strain DAH-3) TaxID=1198029 RepID=A0A1U7LI59_NEOID|nr:ATPase family gene 2 protein [Neolecta irregularis DAH-3]|eukprot:OLL22329.1 ATPase family gene 2 protein [Neolecta irregularis DAH-3]